MLANSNQPSLEFHQSAHKQGCNGQLGIEFDSTHRAFDKSA